MTGLAQIDAAEDEQQKPKLPVRLAPELLTPEKLNPREGALGPMVGRSLAMQHLFTRMRCTAPHFRLAAVEGEQGTGKLLAAQTLHGLGPAASGPWIPCIAADFLDDPQALWREARGGLLYLSRVDELSAEKQRLLRDFLDRAAHERIRTSAAAAPLQLVAGSLQPLRRLAAAGGFRSDLAIHLTAIRLPLPPLRDRRDDIPLLASLFLRRWSRQHDKPLRGFGPGSLERLADWSWPGNVRELESTVAAAALECPGQWIRPLDIPGPFSTSGASSLVPYARRETEFAPSPALPASPSDPAAEDPNLDRAILRHIARVLARADGNKVRAARLLGISRSTLYRLLENAAAPAPSAISRRE